MKIRWFSPDEGFPAPQRLKPLISAEEQALKRQAPPQAVPSHCKPFLDGASCGIALPFGYRAELRVTGAAGSPFPKMEMNFDEGAPMFPVEKVAVSFARGHFSIATRYFLRTEPGIGLLTAPLPQGHPAPGGGAEVLRGLVETWWFPREFFVVFRAPEPGRVFTFRHGDLLCALLPVVCGDYDIAAFTKTEFSEFMAAHAEYEAYRREHPEIAWHSADGFEFDSRYKIFAKKHGEGKKP